MKLLFKLFLIVPLSFINLIASFQQNPIIRGSFDPQRQRSISEDRDRLRDMQSHEYGRSRSTSDTTFVRKMVIEKVTNDTPYTLALMDKHNITTSNKLLIQSMRPQSAYQCSYEIKNSRDTPIECSFDDAQKKEKLMNAAQFKIALFDNSHQPLTGRSNYINLAIVQDAINVRHTHHSFNDNDLHPSIIDINTCKNCDCQPNRIEIIGCSDCHKSLESIEKGSPVAIAVTLKMSEANVTAKTGIIDIDYKCRMQGAFQALHNSL